MTYVIKDFKKFAGSLSYVSSLTDINHNPCWTTKQKLAKRFQSKKDACEWAMNYLHTEQYLNCKIVKLVKKTTAKPTAIPKVDNQWYNHEKEINCISSDHGYWSVGVDKWNNIHVLIHSEYLDNNLELRDASKETLESIGNLFLKAAKTK